MFDCVLLRSITRCLVWLDASSPPELLTATGTSNVPMAMSSTGNNRCVHEAVGFPLCAVLLRAYSAFLTTIETLHTTRPSVSIVVVSTVPEQHHVHGADGVVSDPRCLTGTTRGAKDKRCCRQMCIGNTRFHVLIPRYPFSHNCLIAKTCPFLYEKPPLKPACVVCRTTG